MPGKPSISFDDALRREYEALYASCALDDGKEQLVREIAGKIHGLKARYEAVEAASGVPWYVVGVIHCAECGLSFDRHLHNGDPLTDKTVRVPKDRPPQPPPFTWEQSAADALEYSGLTRWRDWSLAGALYRLEAFNGFGYRIHHPAVKTPYLWSFTTHYRKGKYGTDGKFDPDLVSQQPGCAALLRALEDLGHVRLRPPEPRAPAQQGTLSASPPSVEAAGSIEVPRAAPFARTATARGLLRRAVDQSEFEPPRWIDVPFEGLIVSVGAHALRAHAGARLLRLPVCYRDVIAISNQLGWIPPTAALSDAIWKAATLRLRPVPLGDRSTPERSADTDRRMQTMDFVEEMNRRLDAAIPPARWGELACTEGKDWILSKQNLLPPRAGFPGCRGVANYGWHDPHSGTPVQALQPDTERPPHDDHYFDYSQTLRPIHRLARTPDGAAVDLIEVFERLGMPAAVLAPFRAG